jgi:hypothetical protein
VLAWALSGCSSESLLKRIVRAPDDAYARTFFDSVRFGRTEYAAQRLSPRLWQLPGVRDSLVLLSTHLPHGAIDSMHIVGANRFTNGSVDQSALTYEYHSAQGWGVVTIDVSHELDLRYIDGIRADTLAGALESLNAFTLRGKGGGHYLMLVMWLACAGTTITACVRVLRTPMPRRWLWALFSLVGTGVFAFNWTTGQTGFALLSVRLFVGAVHAVPAAPWILSISFPIGAILALRRVQQARTAPPPVTSAPVSAPAEALPTVIPASSISLGSDGGATPT